LQTKNSSTLKELQDVLERINPLEEENLELNEELKSLRAED
jgi:uncharacterized protein (UPF0335 family)